MNTAARIAAAAAVAAVLSVGSALADSRTSNTLLWDCSRPGAPSLGQVKQLFDEANNYRASLLRVRLQAQLRAECQRGAGPVLFALKQPTVGNAMVLAQAASDAGH